MRGKRAKEKTATQHKGYKKSMRRLAPPQEGGAKGRRNDTANLALHIYIVLFYKAGPLQKRPIFSWAERPRFLPDKTLYNNKKPHLGDKDEIFIIHFSPFIKRRARVRPNPAARNNSAGIHKTSAERRKPSRTKKKSATSPKRHSPGTSAAATGRTPGP